MRKLAVLLSVIGFVSFAACSSSPRGETPGKVIKSAPAGNGLTVSIATPEGVLKHGNTEFTVTFADASGKPVDVGAVAVTFHMPSMGTMPEMNDAASFTTTATAGVYAGKTQIQMAGEWQVKITYEGPKGRGQAAFPISVQ